MRTAAPLALVAVALCGLLGVLALLLRDGAASTGAPEPLAPAAAQGPAPAPATPPVHVPAPAGRAAAGRAGEARAAPGGGELGSPSRPNGGVLQVRVLDGHDQPLAGARVRSSSAELGVSERLTGLDGTADFQGLAGTVQAVSVEAEAHVRREASSIHVPAVGQSQLEFRLARGTFVEGRVLDAERGPVAGAEVRLVARLLATRAEEAGLQGASDEEGRFRLGPVGPGAYVLSASHPEHGHGQVSHLRVREPERGSARAPGGGPAPLRQDVQVRRGWDLTGWVQTPEGRPLPGALVRAVTEGGRAGIRATHSDARGRFALEDLSARSYRLDVRAEGRFPERVPAVSAGVGELVVELRQLAVVAGHAVDAASAAPLESFEVELRRADPRTGAAGGRAGRVHRGNQGRFALDDPGEGAFLVRARAPGYAPVDSEVFELGSGGEAPLLELALERAASLFGRVVAAWSGEPIEGATLTAERWVEGRGWVESEDSARSAPDGRFLIDGLGAGRYRVHASHWACAPAWSAELLLLAGGEQKELPDVPLVRGAILHGVLHDAEGRPRVPGHMVRLTALEQEGSPPLSRTGGRYRFENLAPGPYRLSAVRYRSPSELEEVEVAALELFLAEGEELEQDLHLVPGTRLRMRFEVEHSRR